MNLFQNSFQVLILFALAALAVLTILAALRGWINRRESVTWLFVWGAAATAIIWPKVLSVMAKSLGIGRGADLLLYCAVVTMMVGFMMIYVRLRRLRRELTLLVRQLALRDVVTHPRPVNGAHDPPASSGDETS